MANCLVTKLQAVVDNDRLEKLGIITFDVKASTGSRTLWAMRYHNLYTVVKVLGDLRIEGGQNVTVAADGKSCVCNNLDGTIVLNDKAGTIVFNKYDLASINLNDTFEDTQIYTAQTSKIEAFYGAAWEGDLSDVPITAKGVSFSSGNLTGTIESLSEHVGLTYLIASHYQSLTRAEITSLGKLVLLERFSGPVYGSLESLVAAQRANGRTTGTMRLDYINMGMLDPSTPFVTFNGSAAPSADNKTLSWDATTITYDGVTITA